MHAVVVAALVVLAPAPDLIREHLGPCVVWVARTAAGDEFLRELPDRYRSPAVVVADGRETLTGGRSAYDPETRSLATCPPLQVDLKRAAAGKNLTIVDRD